ncbi:MAG: GGDEF domain-containing protein [Candidatus Sericytochromatia bacterium]
MMDVFSRYLDEHQWRQHFSEQEWSELNELSLQPEFELSAQAAYWSRLLVRWDTRSLNPLRPVYDEVRHMLQVYLDLLAEQCNCARAELNSLLLQLAETQVQLQHKQLLFWRFEYEQKQQRVASLHNDSAQAQAEFYNLSELTQFVSQNLKEESELIHDALDGLMGVLDASWTALYLYEDAGGHAGTFYRLQPGHFEVIHDLVFPHNDFWNSFWKTPVSQARLEMLLEPEPSVEALFPGTQTLLTQTLQMSKQGRGLLMVCSSEYGDFSDFRQFFSIFSTHMASSLQNTRLHARLNELAIRDALTSVFNRRHLEERLHHSYDLSRRYSREMSVLMVDIDHFKAINDTYGHQIGDEVLKQVSAILCLRLRSTDIIGRYGGEEFVAILQETGQAGADIVSHDLVRMVAETPILVPGHPALQVTISVGYAAYPVDALTVETLLKVADTGLYQAKNAGRNRVGFAGQQ